MEFQLLGPVQARDEHSTIPLGGALSRSILAALLLQPNRAVPTKQLIDAAWGESRPDGARTLVQNRVSTLRRVLREAHPGEELIVTTGSGYLIHVEAGMLDADRFADGIARADRLAEAGERLSAVEAFASALALWRGPALDGLTTPYLRAAAQRLEEQRLRALERRIRLDVSLGRHADLVAELTGLVDGYSYHESFHALLMLVLYRTGRHADALAAYRRARGVLTGQLGLEPSMMLQNLHDAILRADTRMVHGIAEQLGCAPASGGAIEPERRIARIEAGVPVPRTLPAADAAFAGRAEELAALDKTLTSARAATLLITGMAGVGKSSLAVHWAHRVADRFPDGQLYLNLGGSAGRELTTTEALSALLGALGARTERPPGAVADLAMRYRSAMADRRALVLLDNASSVEQIWHLLPGGRECVVLITSRDRLSALVAREGAHRMSLDVFRPEEAYALLDRTLGPDRVRAEPVAAHDLARVCAYHPLALRIAATQLVDRPHRRIAEQAARLANGDRLSALTIDGDDAVTVRSAFDLSFDAVPPDAQRLFSQLGQVPDPHLTAPVAAEIAGVEVPEAERLLDRLVAENLVYERDSGRYHLHELVRSYALERATGGPPGRPGS